VLPVNFYFLWLIQNRNGYGGFDNGYKKPREIQWERAEEYMCRNKPDRVNSSRVDYYGCRECPEGVRPSRAEMFRCDNCPYKQGYNRPAGYDRQGGQGLAVRPQSVQRYGQAAPLAALVLCFTRMAYFRSLMIRIIDLDLGINLDAPLHSAILK